MIIEADYKIPLSNDDNSVVKSAKIELDHLCKRILKSNKSLRGKRVTAKDLTLLYQDVLYSDVLRLSSNTGTVRHQIDHVHTAESSKLMDAIREANNFSEA